MEARMKSPMHVLVATILFWAAGTLVAQQFTGRVMDKTGAVVPNAAVNAHNVDTGVTITTKSNSAGAYTIPYLKAGNYSISAEARGFEKSLREGINLQVGETSVVNFTLLVGVATETITVNADTVVDFGKADVGEVVENTRVAELPLNGRDPMMLSELAAGFSTTYTGYTRPFDDTQQYTAINGGGAGNVEMLLDGTPNNVSPINITGGSSENIAHTAYTTPVDAVQEFKMVTSPYDAQYGLMSGGVEDVILKSGTNKVHGDVYEYARRTWMDANLWENDYQISQGQSRSTYKTPNSDWNQYGFELDGPIYIPKIYNGKNKSFFTIQWEHFHALSPLTDVASVPDGDWASGDFSNLDYWTGSAYAPKKIYDPLTSKLDTSTSSSDPTAGAYVRTQFANNQIPSNRIDSLAQRILKMYPHCYKTGTSAISGAKSDSGCRVINGSADHWASNYALSTSGTDTYNNILLKWDENWSTKDRFTLRYGYWMRNTYYSGNGLPAPLTTGEVPIVARAHSFAMDETHTFSANVVLDFRANVSVRDDVSNAGSSYNETALGWSESQVTSLGPAALSTFPKLCFGSSWYGAACYGWGSPGDFTTAGGGGNSATIKNSLNLLPTVTWIKGSHTIHGGIDVRLWQNGYQELGGGPLIWTDNTWTWMTANHAYNIPNDGNDIAAFAMGVPTVASNQIWPQTYQSQHYFAPFVQDDWKITKKLTLNIGIRWDFMPSEVERHNKGNYAFDTISVNPYLTSVNLSTYGHGSLVGGITFAGVNGNPRGAYKTVKTNIQPRFGFAYALNNKTVIRGGFGESMQQAQNGFNVAGYSAATNGVTSNPNYGSGIFPNLLNPLESLFWGGPTGSVLQPTGSSLGLGTNLGQSGSYINPAYKTPKFWSYSLGFERQFMRNSSVNLSYVGSRLYDGNSSGNINMQSNALRATCNPILGGNPTPCGTDGGATDSYYTANPFQGISAFSGSNYYTSSRISIFDLSRPMPQFQDVTENEQNDARTWYNSLQITVLHKFSDSLTLHGTETWSKTMDAGTWADQNYGVRNRTIDSNDMAHRITISGIYQLPFGRGHMLLSHVNRLLDEAVNGWQLAGMSIIQSGVPQSVPGYYLHNAKLSRHIQSNGYIRVFAPYAEHYVQNGNGSWSVQQYDGSTNNGSVFHYTYDGTNTGVVHFMDVPSYAPSAMVEYSGIRQAGLRRFDASFSKNFPVYKTMKLQIRLDAFNVLNHPEWTGGADTSTSFDANLGVITKGPTGSSVDPRRMQLSGKLTW
jgi:hypothetical protein